MTAYNQTASVSSTSTSVLVNKPGKKVVACPTSGPIDSPTPFETAVLALSPLAYWPMDEAVGTTTATDLSGNGYTGTASSVPAGAAGPGFLPGALPCAPSDPAWTNAVVNGEGMFSSSAPQTNVTAWTSMCWFRAPSGNTNAGQLMGAYQDGVSGLVLGANSTGFSFFGEETSHGVYAGVETPTKYNDGRWHFFVGTWAAASGASVVPSQFSLYIDGVLIANPTALTGASVSSPLSSTNTQGVGWANKEVNSNGSFVGSIGHAAIFTTALTQADVTTLWQAASTTANVTPSRWLPALASAASSGAITNALAVIRTASSVSTGAIQRAAALSRTFLANVTSLGAAGHGSLKTVTASVTSTSAAVRSVGKQIVSSVTSTGGTLAGKARAFTATVISTARLIFQRIIPPPTVVYRFGAPFSQWRIGTVSVVQMDATSLDWVTVPVRGLPANVVDPTGDVVLFAFGPPEAMNAEGLSWTTGAWMQSQSNPWWAACLVGPLGAVTLDVGTYSVFVQIGDIPTTPVVQVGTLTIQ